jgi:hypothetical protein
VPKQNPLSLGLSKACTSFPSILREVQGFDKLSLNGIGDGDTA